MGSIIVIGPKIIAEAGDMVAAQLRDYEDEINDAYLNCDDALTVSVPIKFKPGAGSKTIDIETKISFYTGKVTDQAKRTVSETDSDDGEIFDNQQKERDRLRGILWRDFSELRRRLDLLFLRLKRMHRQGGDIAFRSFKLPVEPTMETQPGPGVQQIKKGHVIHFKHGKSKPEPGKRVEVLN